MERMSLTLEQCAQLKRDVTGGKSYSDRLSVAMVFQLMKFRVNGDVSPVLWRGTRIESPGV